MNYEKLTVDRFALNLKEGKYETLTGARRAIGKTSSWGAKDKEKAHDFANKHFKVEGATKPVKAPKVAAAKTAGPKTAKKQGRKAAKKTVLPDTIEKEAPEIAATASVEPKAPFVRRPVNAATPRVQGDTSVLDAVGMGRQVLAFLNEAKPALEFQKHMNPGGNFDRALAAMNDGFTRAVTLVSTSLPTGDSIENVLPPPRVSLPKETAVTPVHPAKASVKAHQAPPPAVVAAAAPSAPPVTASAPPPFNGTGSPLIPSPAKPEEANLTPEEREMADKLRNATPASTIAALPRPVTPQG